MKTSNQKLFDALMQRQVRLGFYSEGLAQRAVIPLQQSEDDVEDEVYSVAARLQGEPLSTKRAKSWLTRFRDKLLRIRGEAWQKVQENSEDELGQLVVDESRYITDSIQEALPLVLTLTLPTAVVLRAALRDERFNGYTLREWLGRTRTNDINRIFGTAWLALQQGATPTQTAARVVGTKSARRYDGVIRTAWSGLRATLDTATTVTQSVATRETAAVNDATIGQVIFVATLDVRTTDVCQGNDGKVFDIGKGPQPPLHFRCRSRRVPYLDRNTLVERAFDPTTEAELLQEFTKAQGIKVVRTRDSLPYGTKTMYDRFARKRKRELIGSVPGTTRYPDWLKTQSAEFQRQAKRNKMRYTLDQL